MGRGGLSRLDDVVSTTIIDSLKKDQLTTETVENVLNNVDLEARCLLVNTLGGRVPYGYRLAGADAATVKRRIEDRVERLLRRLEMITEKYADLIQ